MSDYRSDDQLDAVADEIDGWLASIRADNPAILSIDRVAEEGTKWFVRMQGEDKEFITLWLALGQRTLKYETYMMPAPEENHGRVYEYLLRRNDELVGAHFSIGREDGIYLRGALALDGLSEPEVDRIIGTLWVTTERWFQILLRLGFASRFATSPRDDSHS